MPEGSACAKCGAPLEKTPLHKCPMCFKMVCEACRYMVHGRSFCSSPCAQFFFFTDDEDEP